MPTDLLYKFKTRCYSEAAGEFFIDAYKQLNIGSLHPGIFTIIRDDDGEIIVEYAVFHARYNSEDHFEICKKTVDITQDEIGRYFCKFIKNEYLRAWLLDKIIILGAEELIGHPLNPFEIEANRLKREMGYAKAVE